MFIQENFMLKTNTALHLYYEYAQRLPIIDYHCHLPPAEIAENKRWKNISEIWLAGDHYKWRLMRAFGIPERCITGDASDKEKFDAYAKTVSYAIGNPLYHWTHLELQRCFGIKEILNADSADKIWDQANEQLASREFSAKSLIAGFNVRYIGTTDDPLDNLRFHNLISEDKNFAVQVAPSFRPDNVLKIEQESFKTWFANLEKTFGRRVESSYDLFSALRGRLDYFGEAGCTISDHGLDRLRYMSENEAQKKGFTSDMLFNIIYKRLKDEALSTDEVIFYKSELMRFFGKEYAKRNWIMQLHIGVLRNNNVKYFEKLGADCGFDSADDKPYASELSAFLNDLDYTDELPKTVLYNLNPAFNYMLSEMAGNFQSGGIKGKIQFGSGWWFNDQRDGMEAQIKTLANSGMLSCFIGMITDSRSFLSYTRHEYFRRILCNIIGTWIEDGEFPNDTAFAGKIVEDICYRNARTYCNLNF